MSYKGEAPPGGGGEIIEATDRGEVFISGGDDEFELTPGAVAVAVAVAVAEDRVGDPPEVATSVSSVTEGGIEAQTVGEPAEPVTDVPESSAETEDAQGEEIPHDELLDLDADVDMGASARTTAQPGRGVLIPRKRPVPSTHDRPAPARSASLTSLGAALANAGLLKTSGQPRPVLGATFPAGMFPRGALLRLAQLVKIIGKVTDGNTRVSLFDLGRIGMAVVEIVREAANAAPVERERANVRAESSSETMGIVSKLEQLDQPQRPVRTTAKGLDGARVSRRATAQHEIGTVVRGTGALADPTSATEKFPAPPVVVVGNPKNPSVKGAALKGRRGPRNKAEAEAARSERIARGLESPVTRPPAGHVGSAKVGSKHPKRAPGVLRDIPGTKATGTRRRPVPIRPASKRVAVFGAVVEDATGTATEVGTKTEHEVGTETEHEVGTETEHEVGTETEHAPEPEPEYEGGPPELQDPDGEHELQGSDDESAVTAAAEANARAIAEAASAPPSPFPQPSRVHPGVRMTKFMRRRVAKEERLKSFPTKPSASRDEILQGRAKRNR